MYLTLFILSIGTEMPEQTVWTQIRHILWVPIASAQMSTNNIWFYKENQKKKIHVFDKSFIDLFFFFFLKCSLSIGRYIFYHKFRVFMVKINVTPYLQTAERINPCPAEPGYTLPLQTVLIKISWLLKKPTDLDLHCLPLSMWIYSKNLDQVIWLAEKEVGVAS